MQLHYFELHRMKTGRYFLRQRLVTYVRTHGIKAIARSLWLLPKHCPQMTVPLPSQHAQLTAVS